jgi:predicted dehydrogenase
MSLTLNRGGPAFAGREVNGTAKIMKANGRARRAKKVRYAVVGLGHIAQVAVLPGFENARRNSELAALVSDDPVKLRTLGRNYKVTQTFGYDEYEACLHSGEIDAVYIALPNNQHRDFAIRAARAGIHVLCEKPLALDEDECHEIIRACAEGGVKLMTAYRLHFERANLEAIRVLQSGTIGEPRFFNSHFSMQVKEGNIRLQRALGGGTLYDIGIYCINAARYLFRSEPTEVFAFSANNGEKRFREVDEMTSAILRFPDQRLASFTCSFGAADTAVFDVIGTRGTLRVLQAYEHSEAMEMEITVNGRSRKRRYARRDQFGPELVYFSDCILKGREPEPSGVEGLLDVHIIRSLLHSARHGISVKLEDLRRRRRPSLRQEIYRRPARRGLRVHTVAPTR